MEKKPKSKIDLFRLLSFAMLHRRVEIEKQHNKEELFAKVGEDITNVHLRIILRDNDYGEKCAVKGSPWESHVVLYNFLIDFASVLQGDITKYSLKNMLHPDPASLETIIKNESS